MTSYESMLFQSRPFSIMRILSNSRMKPQVIHSFFTFVSMDRTLMLLSSYLMWSVLTQLLLSGVKGLMNFFNRKYMETEHG